MKPMVLYFSPTGGTEKVAKIISDKLGIEAIDITVFDYHMNLERDRIVFFCFPVYGGRIPSVMYSRMENIIGDKTPAVMVAVYGNRAVEDALIEMSDLCARKGFVTVGGCEMIAPHSMDKRIAADRPNASDAAALGDFVSKVVAKTENEVTAVKMPGNRMYRKYTGVGVRPSSSKKCEGCGTCAAECPTHAIDPGDPHKADENLCISCMRCVSMCPFEIRKLPLAAQLATSAFLLKACAGKKEPKFYI